ncbi:TPA: NADAR family protein [Acinetobacter baumannii]|uniref:NADAR family protein n=1 Tax=Acinetobacter calcoaceticus/baumannii complex TaxID=909768 RepID=UPI000DD0B967|nr:NADAR family protein [Acinetobacter baumannii]MDX7936695.1 NADAR family protein [Acinetobacter baumannii]HCA5050126.1 NADAR family protein [Acinetobacter baumannii]
MDKLAERIYDPSTQELAVFKKTKEEWGGFSNMAADYPISINGQLIRSSEALYQALKYTHYPDIQKKILQEYSPMTAKMVGKPYKQYIRDDFEDKKIIIMKWSVRAKLMCNFEKFSAELLASENRIIVEESRRDNFWGAKRVESGHLVGVNVLGRILMELRDLIKEKSVPDILYPLNIENFNLYGEPIEAIHKQDKLFNHNDYDLFQ